MQIRLKWWDIPLGILLILVWASPVIIDLLKVENSVWGIRIVFIGFSACSIVTFWQIILDRKRNEKQFEDLRKQFKEKLSILIKASVSEMLDLATRSIINNPSISLRANIMLVRGHLLKMFYYSSNMALDPDTRFETEKLKGCAGTAWANGQPTFADTSIPGAMGAATWNLTEEEKQITKKAVSILSIPLWRIENQDDNNEVFGVFSIDSSIPLSVVNFRDEAIQNRAVGFSLVLSILLRAEENL